MCFCVFLFTAPRDVLNIALFDRHGTCRISSGGQLLRHLYNVSYKKNSPGRMRTVTQENQYERYVQLWWSRLKKNAFRMKFCRKQNDATIPLFYTFHVVKTFFLWRRSITSNTYFYGPSCLVQKELIFSKHVLCKKAGLSQSDRTRGDQNKDTKSRILF